MTSFGVSGQAELSRQNALANQIQGYNTSQAAEELASNQNIAAINTAYQTGLTNATNQIAVSKAEALLQYAEKLRQEKLAEQQAIDAWNRQVEEQKRQEAVAEQQAIAAWNRQIEEQKRQEALAKLNTATKSAKSSNSKTSGSSASSILTTTKKQTPTTTNTKSKKVLSYDYILSEAKNIYNTKGSDINIYLSNLVTGHFK